jgi:heme/copper-type cytochrome/quinol oxidase subunit 4
MDTIKLEKRLRLVPLACVLLIIVLRRFIGEEYTVALLVITIFLASIATGSFFYTMHLEKKSGRYKPKKYTLFYFFIIITVAVFAYSYIKV